jgi:DNA polymerase
LIAAQEQVKTAFVTLMQPFSPLGREIAGALQWWRDAGLEHDFTDDPADWLACPAPAVTEAAPVPPQVEKMATPKSVVRLGGARDSWPQDLAAFSDWWLAEPSLDNGQLGGRVAPRGPAEAPLMVLVDYPESNDTDRLLSGQQGRLLDAILAALGIDPGQVYVASLLPRHMPLPDWPALAEAGLGDLALHHVALAAPKRLISFGANVSPLLGHDPAKTAETLPQTYQVGAQVPALAAPGLETLMARPRGKARLWQALLDWQAA